MAIQARKRKTGVPNPVELYVSLRNYIESRPTRATQDDLAELASARTRAVEYANDYGLSVPKPGPLEVKPKAPQPAQ